MKLVIAEKPEVAEAIAKTLSDSPKKMNGYYDCPNTDFVVTYAKGHLLRLAEPQELNPDLKKWDLKKLPMSWPIKFVPNERTKSQLNIIGNLLNKASVVYNGADLDNAGEFIFVSIIEHFNKQYLPVKRLFINDNNLIAKAFENVKDGKDSYNNAMAEKGRFIADAIYGFNMTRTMTQVAKSLGWNVLLTIGRVQTYIVCLVVARELQIANFVKSKYYTVDCSLQVGSAKLTKIKYQVTDADPVDEAKRIIDRDFAFKVASDCIDKQAKLVYLNQDLKEVTRPLPYDLSSLQSDCDRLFNYSPDVVLKTTQSLRDKKMITYNRTDSRYLNDESFNDAPELLKVLGQIPIFKALTEAAQFEEKSKAFNSNKTTAHHGIIPTHNIEKFDSLSPQELNIYGLIFRNYVVQFLPSHIKRVTNYEFSIETRNNIHHFVGTHRQVVREGWHLLFLKEPLEDNDEDDEDDPPFNIEDLVVGNDYYVLAANAHDKETSAPAHYSITSLLSDMKNAAKYVSSPELKEMLLARKQSDNGDGGVGTAATRTPILTETFKKGYLVKKAKKIRMTEQALILYQSLPPSIRNPDITAVWAHQQTQIEEGLLSVESFVNSVQQFTSDEVNRIKENGINIPKHLIFESSNAECPRCKSLIQRKPGKFGPYWPCPKCDMNFNDKDGKPYDKDGEPKNIARCPKCGGDAIEKFGRYGKYWSCETCGNLQDYNGGPFFEACPKCGKSLKIRSAKPPKKGRFLSCSGFPDCDHSTKLD